FVRVASVPAPPKEIRTWATWMCSGSGMMPPLLFQPLDDVPAVGALLGIVGGHADAADLELESDVAEGRHHLAALVLGIDRAHPVVGQAVDALAGVVGEIPDQLVEVVALLRL